MRVEGSSVRARHLSANAERLDACAASPNARRAGGARHRRHAAAVASILTAAVAWCACAGAQAPPPTGFPGEAPQGPPAEIVSFRAEPARLRAGDSTTLTWEGLNAFSLTIAPDVGAVATRGSATVTPARTTTYTLTVTGSDGEERESVTVTVEGAVPAAVSSAEPDARQRDIPRLADGKPDLSGVYLGGRGVRLADPVSLRPGAERFRVPQRDDDLGQGALCLPPGVPAATMMPYPLQIVARPDVVVILYEAYNLFRIIPIGRSAPDDLDPLWMGYSVGRWDGDTLVVEVSSFNDKTIVSGHRHTEAMRVTERYRRTSRDVIEYQAVVTDPNVFAEPVEYRGDLVLHPEWEIGEYVCAENMKDYSELFE
ncbi:MAG: hypothetical protein JXB36_13260 [Gammaproteobacteria bacterium]|nr:hypothetical protein [Gammaproteobacteria bacterium]